MTAAWSTDELERIDSADELRIAGRRTDGPLRRWVPIWVACAGGQVYVRTWHRRGNGWFGRVLHTRRARIRVPGLEVDVAVQDVGDESDLRPHVDAAYRATYGRHGDLSVDRMVTDDAAAPTLRLVPEWERGTNSRSEDTVDLRRVTRLPRRRPHPHVVEVFVDTVSDATHRGG